MVAALYHQNNHMKKMLMLIALLLIGSWAIGQHRYFEKDSLAIRGYDPVAYFTESKAVKGDPHLFYNWQGSKWLFATDAHRQAFIKTPEAFAPQFGGYCAYGVSENHLSPTDPQAWTIVNGKLYLNYSPKVKSLWLPDTASRIPSAQQFWPNLQHK
jgi:hypothetical protein